MTDQRCGCIVPAGRIDEQCDMLLEKLKKLEADNAVLRQQIKDLADTIEQMFGAGDE